MTLLPYPKLLLVGFAASLLVACSDDPEPKVEKAVPAAVSPELNLLAYAPADTPYVIANTKRIPRQDIELLVKKFKPIYSRLASDMQKSIAEEGLAEKPEGKVITLLINELVADFSLEKLDNIGLKPDAYMALFGLGPLPMIRLEMADEAKFKAFLGRLETEAKEKMPVAQFEGKEYWRIEAEEAVISIALVEGQLAVGLAPTKYQEKTLPYLFGKKPEKSLADTNRLQDVLNKFGFSGYGAGFMDFQQTADLSFGKGSALSKESWASLDIPQETTTEVCQQEINQLTAQMPKLVFGYTEFSPKRMVQKLILELEPTLASALQKLSAPVPGIGSGKGLMNMGIGFNAVEAQKFLLTVAKTRADTPYQCEWLAELNQMGKPENMAPLMMALPPFAADIKGINVVVTELEMPPEGTMAPPKSKLHAVLRADNPQNLYGMAAMMLPGVAELGLKPDGVAHPVPPGVIPPIVDAPHIAMSEQGIGVSIGEGMNDSLASFMSAPSAPEQPIFAISYDMALLAEMVRPGMAIAMASMEPEMAKEVESQLEAMEHYKDIFGPYSLSLGFTKQGVQIQQGIELK